MTKTPLQEFLDQIILKQIKGSVYLIPAITDIQIKEALEKEKSMVIESHVNCVRNGYKKEGNKDWTDEDEKLVREDIQAYYNNTFNNQ